MFDPPFGHIWLRLTELLLLYVLRDHIYTLSQGIKRRRWSIAEEEEFFAAFRHQIEKKRNVSSEDIRAAKKKFKLLQGRPEAVIRAKANNIALGKLKCIH